MPKTKRNKYSKKSVRQSIKNPSPSKKASSENIPFDVLVNCILISENIRPACLIQHAALGESETMGPKMRACLKDIRKLFPYLIASYSYDGNHQGTIIGKRSYDNQFIDMTEMGIILGYPCADEDFFEMIKNKYKNYIYTFEINFHFDQKKTEAIYANMCSSDKHEKEFEDLAEKCREMFLPTINEKYSHLANRFIGLTDIKMEKGLRYPIQHYTQKIINHETMDENEEKLFLKELYDSFFEDQTLYDTFISVYQPENPIHQGIIIGVLSYLESPPIAPYYGTDMLKEANDNIIQYCERINEVLKESRI